MHYSSRQLLSALLLLWTGLILVALSYPLDFPGDNSGITLYDKIIHAGLFGMFTYLLSRRLGFSNPGSVGTIALLGLVGGFAYAGAAEYWQSLLATRTSSFLDLIAGWIGSTLATAIFYVKHGKQA